MRIIAAALALAFLALSPAAADARDWLPHPTKPKLLYRCSACRYGCFPEDDRRLCHQSMRIAPKAKPASAPEAPTPAFCRWWALDAPQCAT